MKPHEKLEVWKLSFNLVKKIYGLTANFPKEEKFGLTSQLRRAAASIPVNISEGSARRSDRELQQFLYIALGSASELDTLLMLSMNLNLQLRSWILFLNYYLVLFRWSKRESTVGIVWCVEGMGNRE